MLALAAGGPLGGLADLATSGLVHQVAGLLALATSAGVVWWLERPAGRWADRLRSRLLLGVPWGSLVVVAGVVAFYLFAQHGWSHWYNPVTLPYSSWSYLYPLGWLTAAFAHAGSSHLIGNMMATLAVFPLAEYAYGHFPRDRGSQSFASVATNPFVRAFVVVPTGTVLVGIAMSLFSWGPVIGFSGVLFAGIGFVAVRYPLGAVVALVAEDVVTLVYRVLLNPIVVRTSSERFVTPPWAEIAVQGHALGLFLGVALGVLVFYRERLVSLPYVGDRYDEPPSTVRLWFGALVLGLSLNLWALWWYRGVDTFVLYRGLGLAFVAIVAVLVTAAVRSSDAPFEDDDGPTSRQVAVGVLLVPLLVMAGVAVPLNTLSVDEGAAPQGPASVEVRDYTVVYAEGVPNQLTSVVDLEAFGETTQVNTSGVIVVSERREVWSTHVSKRELASKGSTEVVVGGPTWRETVFVKREGWSALGGGSAYRVRIGPERGNTRVAYTSGNATAGAVLGGRNVSVRPRDEGFVVQVRRNGTRLGTAPIPPDNQSVTTAGITFVREGPVVEARLDGTRVDVFRKENS